MKKIICDVCENEINIDDGMSMYESIKVDKTAIFKNNKADVTKITLDICANCSTSIEKYIHSIKQTQKGGDSHESNT